MLAGGPGDAEPLEISGRRVWRLADDDQASGADFAATARAEIEVLRAKGAGYLVFTGAARAALDTAPALREHLDARYRRVISEEELVLYELTAPRVRARAKRSHRVPGIERARRDLHADHRLELPLPAPPAAQ